MDFTAFSTRSKFAVQINSGYSARLDGKRLSDNPHLVWAASGDELEPKKLQPLSARVCCGATTVVWGEKALSERMRRSRSLERHSATATTDLLGSASSPRRRLDEPKSAAFSRACPGLRDNSPAGNNRTTK